MLEEKLLGMASSNKGSIQTVENVQVDGLVSVEESNESDAVGSDTYITVTLIYLILGT